MILICLISFCIILALVVRIMQKPRVPYEKEIRKLLKLCNKTHPTYIPTRAYYDGFCSMVSNLGISNKKQNDLLEFLRGYLPLFGYCSWNLYWFTPHDMETRKLFLNQVLTFLKSGIKP